MSANNYYSTTDIAELFDKKRYNIMTIKYNRLKQSSYGII